MLRNFPYRRGRWTYAREGGLLARSRRHRGIPRGTSAKFQTESGMNANRMVIVVADSHGEDLAVIQVVASTQRADQAFPGNLRCNRPCSVRGIRIAAASQHRRVSDEL